MNTTGGIETVLAEHRYVLPSGEDYFVSCTCGWAAQPLTKAKDFYPDQHRAHIAAALAAHLLSDAVVERATRRVIERAHIGSTSDITRAALAAAVGGDTR